MTEIVEVPATLVTAGTLSTKTGQERLPHISHTLELLKSDPDRSWTPKEIAVTLHAKPSTIRKDCTRLSQACIGVVKDGYGRYRYAPDHAGKNLLEWARSAEWKIENLTFVTLEPPTCCVATCPDAKPNSDSGTERQSEATSEAPACNRSRIPKDLPGYPRWLPTGQKVSWRQYDNGTQVWGLAANGNPPFSADHALTLIDEYEREDTTGQQWGCSSIEININGEKRRDDPKQYYSIQGVKGALLKGYRHDDHFRLELAERRNPRDTTTREIKDLLHAIAVGVNAQGILRELDTMSRQYTEKIALSDARSRYAYGALADLKNRVELLEKNRESKP